jgi:ribosomal-protein-alanine N-acetyltransferase
VIIETERTRLRRFTLSDLSNMRMLESDADIMKFTPSRVPQTVEQSEKRLRSLVEKEPTYSPLGVWAVEQKSTADFVAWFMLVTTQFDFPELGFMIVKRHWGKGFASEVSASLIDYGIKELKYSGIVATTNPENSVSIRVLEKVGFTFSKTISSHDKVFKRDLELNVFEYRSKLR